jgi:hypothetical protein
VWSIFHSPISTFDSLSERPRWFTPLLLAAVYTTLVNYYVVNRIGFLRLMTKAAQAASSLDPQAVLQNAMAHQTQIVIVQSVSTFLGGFATALVIAMVLWLLVLLLGGDVSFRKVLAVAAHISLFTTVLRQSMLAITVTVGSDLDNLNLKNPLATNPAFFVQTNSHLANQILSSLDLFTLLTVFLLVMGLTKVCDRISRIAASLIVLIPWSIYVVGGAWFFTS